MNIYGDPFLNTAFNPYVFLRDKIFIYSDEPINVHLTESTIVSSTVLITFIYTEVYIILSPNRKIQLKKEEPRILNKQKQNIHVLDCSINLPDIAAARAAVNFVSFVNDDAIC